MQWSWFDLGQTEFFDGGMIGVTPLNFRKKINFLWGDMDKATKYVLAATFLSFMFSIYLFFFMDSPDSKLYGIFVGIWVPSILSAFTVLRTSFRKEN